MEKNIRASLVARLANNLVFQMNNEDPPPRGRKLFCSERGEAGLGVVDLRLAWVGVLQEVEELAVVL
jgi:hypothetical protein